MGWLNNLIMPLICVWIWGLLLLITIYAQGGVNNAYRKKATAVNQTYAEHFNQFTFYMAVFWAVEILCGIGIGFLIFRS